MDIVMQQGVGDCAAGGGRDDEKLLRPVLIATYFRMAVVSLAKTGDGNSSSLEKDSTERGGRNDRDAHQVAADVPAAADAVLTHLLLTAGRDAGRHPGVWRLSCTG